MKNRQLVPPLELFDDSKRPPFLPTNPLDDELSHYQDGVLCSVSPGLTVWPMGDVGDGVRWPELPSSARWNEGNGRERGREAEKERKRGR